MTATPLRLQLVRRPVTIAAAVGVVGLAAGGGAGFGLTKVDWNGSEPTATAATTLTLPSSLSGGFKRSKKIDKQIASSVSSAQTALGAGTDMALYVHAKTDQILVEATRLPGKALLNAGMTYAKVGDVVCSSQSGSEAICTRSDEHLTVQVTAADSDTASTYADEVYADLATTDPAGA